jgi:hypothetical protein
MKCTLDAEIKALRHKIFEIQDAKNRLVVEYTILMKHYKVKRKQARQLERRLEEGHRTCRSYADWTKVQMRDKPPFTCHRAREK